MQLEARIALVTGAARGIGLALTRGLIARGCRVIAVGRNQAALDGLVRDEPGVVAALQADLASPSDVDAVLERIRADWPDVSIVVNNAGIQVNIDFLDPDSEARVDEWRREIAVNLTAVVRLSTGLLPTLMRQPDAAIVNVTSGLAIAPKRSAPVYCATKAALRSFTKALRYQCEDACLNVAVIDVVMSIVDTDMTTGRGYRKITAEHAAQEVLNGLAESRNDIAVGRSRALIRLARVAPGLAERMMRDA